MGATTESAEAENRVDQFAVIAIVFMLSGLSSLIYQVIWTRQLVFVFGSSTFASATVLSAFMGGLALGSFTAGRRADRISNPLILYAGLEAFIGFYAMLAPLLFDAAIPIYRIVWQHLNLSILPFSLLRFAVLALILLPPTACMGATLPLLARFVTVNLQEVSKRVGTLYSLNSLGAVLGSLLAGFVLIPSMGLSATTYSAASINILLGMIVYFFCRSGRLASLRFGRGDAMRRPAGVTYETTSFDQTNGTKNRVDVEPAERSATVGLAMDRSIKAVLIAMAISGAAAMVNEVAWTRALLMIIGSTTYAFSIMLSTFLAGIFLGSLISARIADRLKEPVLWLAVLQIILCAAQLLSIWIFNYLPYWNVVANLHFQNNPTVGMYIRFGLAATILVPITLFLGATFPLAVRICANDLQRVGRSVGVLYSVNTFGAVFGAFAAGFMIIPSIGGELTLIVCALVHCLIGAGLLFACSSKWQWMKLMAAAVAALLTLWVLQKPVIWDYKLTTFAQNMRRGLSAVKKEMPPFDESRKIVDKRLKLLFYRDGISSNVAVTENDGCISLYTNGHVDASTAADVYTQALLSSIPLLLNPQAKEVGAVGWGSGATVGYALLFPVKKVVCAEIEGAVLETSKFFHTINFAPESDPRMKAEINDGRNYLLATDETFDVIASEPSNPWQAGVCNLFTEEYFRTCHDRLKPGGIFSLWCQYIELSHEDLAKIFSALKRVYQHVVIFTTSTDIIAVAADTPLKINLEAVKHALKNERLQSILGRAGISSAEDLASRVVIADDGVDKIVQNEAACTDDRNYIEFDVAKIYEQAQFSQANAKWIMQHTGSLWQTIDWGNMSETEKAETMNRVAERALAHNIPSAGLWAKQSYNESPNSHALQIMAMIEATKLDDYAQALKTASKAVLQFPKDEQAWCMKGLIELMGGAPMRARQDFTEALRLSPENKIYKYRLAQTFLPQYRSWYQATDKRIDDISLAKGDPHKVLSLLGNIVDDENFVAATPGAQVLLAAAYLQLDNYASGIKLMKKYLQSQPDDKLAVQLLNSALVKAGKKTN